MRRMAMKRLWLFIFSAFLATAHALTVEAPTKDVKVARGNNVTLQCYFKTEALISEADIVVWKKINSPHDAVSRYFDGFVQYGEGYENRIQFSGDVAGGNVSITLSAVTMEDNGTYACSVRLRNDPPRETAILTLLVLVAPSKPECNILGTAEYGQNINLTCISHEGSPKPKYTWQSFNVRNEPRVLQTTEAPMSKQCADCPFLPRAGWMHYYRYEQRPSVLRELITLKNISADTSGFYICTSTNIVGKEFCNMTVSVVPPSMNIALYAGIIGGAVAAIIVIGILTYCCCCRERKDMDYEMTEQQDRNEPHNETHTRNQHAEDNTEDE